ncbi:hypothetical protein BY458DRAFT_487344 [Sporodiniella umbellata]|nr:hypothetical protein BY458DRAFT_487344 [Sporodiniella umbellata]
MVYSRKLCYKCGKAGHFVGDCPEAEKLCYNCRLPGHISSECTSEKVFDPPQCFACNEAIFNAFCFYLVGHIQSECTTAQAKTRPPPQCYNCQQFNQGHMAKECTLPSQPRERSTYSRPPRVNTRPKQVVVCHRCGGINHFAKDCKASDILCFQCNKYGHVARDCTVEAPLLRTHSRRVTIKSCYNCQKSGHIARHCTTSREKEESEEDDDDYDRTRQERSYSETESEFSEASLAESLEPNSEEDKQKHHP